MKTAKFERTMNTIAPLSLQEDWDNSGWQIRIGTKVSRVLVSLEITEEVINEAITKNCDTILTHHPLFFNGIKIIDDNTITGNYVKLLVQNGISVYSSHTPFDIAEGGNNDYLGQLLGFGKIKLLDGDEDKICRMGSLKKPAIIADFVKNCSEKLGLDKRYFSYSGCGDLTIKKAAWCTGAGSDYISLAKDAKCDLFITGDLKYHQAILAKELGIGVLDLGHYGTEKIFSKNVIDLFVSNLDKSDKIKFIESETDINPFTVLE